MRLPPLATQHTEVGPNDPRDTFAAMIRQRMSSTVFSGAAVLAVVVGLGAFLTKAAAVTAKTHPTTGPTTGLTTGPTTGLTTGPTAAEIEKRADALLARMTLDEKVDYL